MSARRHVVTDQNGEIVRTLVCPADQAALQAQAGEHCFQSDVADAATHYATANGNLVEYAPAHALAKRSAPAHPATWSNASMAWSDCRSLAQAKGDAWERVKAERAARLAAPLVVAGRAFQVDPSSAARILEAVVDMLVSPRGSRAWTLADNSDVSLTAGEMAAVVSASAARADAVNSASQVMRRAIQAAPDAAAVAAVTWPAG